MEDELASARQAFVQAAEALSQSRQRYAEELGEGKSASMHELAMPDGRFAIEVRPDAQQPLAPWHRSGGVHGHHQPGSAHPSNPLARWLPGGELSRISLAIVVISAQDSTPTPYLRRSGCGISGPTAAVVGRLLRQLGESTR